MDDESRSTAIEYIGLGLIVAMILLGLLATIAPNTVAAPLVRWIVNL